MTGVKGGTAQMPGTQEKQRNLSTAMPGRSKHSGVRAPLRSNLQGCSDERINAYMSGTHKRAGG